MKLDLFVRQKNLSESQFNRYYDFLTVAFVTVLLCSNLINPAKVTEIAGITFSTGTLFFPLTYLLGDVLSEVYGFQKARRVIILGFLMLAFATLNAAIVVWVPPAPGWNHQEAYEIVFGSTWRVMLGSLVAYFAGEISNAYILVRMKTWTNGRFLFLRTIGSTIIGQIADSFLFLMIGFYGVFSNEMLWRVMASDYIVKVLWEVIATPLTYMVIMFLKKAQYSEQLFSKPQSLNASKSSTI